METTIRISKQEILIALHNATVIHANKYTDVRGGFYHSPVNSTLYTDVVFRSKTNIEDWPIYIRSLDLPIYTGQEVMVISADNIIVGYVDKQTGHYYYTTTDLANKLGLGMWYYLVWLIGIVAGIILFFVDQNKTQPLVWFSPLAITWIFYRVQKWVIHRRVKKTIDGFLRDA